MKNAKVGYLSLLAALVISGCASGYKAFYEPVEGIDPQEIELRREAPPPVTPRYERSAPVSSNDDLAPYFRRGYTLIGYSMFNSGMPENESNAIKQGQTVRADLVVILDPEYTGSTTTSIPITVPTTTTSHTTGSATAYGSGRPVSVYGSATTTTYGTTTNYVPMTVHRSNYGALYFVKTKSRLGAFALDLNDEQRNRIQSNQGAVISLVVDNSPAYYADLLPGDIILEMNELRISNAESYSTALEALAGKNITITIMRGTNKLIKQVQLNPK